jgi:hypothetical protein
MLTGFTPSEMGIQETSLTLRQMIFPQAGVDVPVI